MGEFTTAAVAGQKALDEGDLDLAERALGDAVRLRPDHRESWYNLALVHKFRRNWRAAFEAGLRAVPGGATGVGNTGGNTGAGITGAGITGAVDAGAVDAGAGDAGAGDAGAEDPAWWNLGIAATALGDWEVARRAWRAYGIELPAGEGEFEADLGATPIRINPGGEAEVVWGVRLDPARARLVSVPTPQSGHRWGDIVLHDGVPSGERRVGRRAYPVFDELELWRRSETATLSVRLRAASEEDVAALVDAVEGAGGGAEDWSTIRLLCADCSLGTPGHDHAAAPWDPSRTVGLAVAVAEAERLLTEWRAAAPDRREFAELTEAS